MSPVSLESGKGGRRAGQCMQVSKTWASITGFKDGGRAKKSGVWGPLETGKDEETEFSIEPPERIMGHLTP